MSDMPAYHATVFRRWALALCLVATACDETTRPLLVEDGDRPWAVRGAIVSQHGARDGWVVFHRGVIVSIESDESALPAKARRLRYEGYIFPGLIDTHNHPHYNFLPRWRPPRTYQNRYEWIGSEEYRREVQTVYDSLSDAELAYAALKYGEVRALIGGTTSIQGTYVPEEAGVLIRNLGREYGLSAYTLDIRRLSSKDVKTAIEDLRYGRMRRCFLHLAEGKDAGSTGEFEVLRERGFVREGVVLIHGVGLKRRHFDEMADAGMFLVWSPSSNLTLYGETADVMAAIEAGVVVALAPDWTVTGSDNVLEEMKIAHEFSERELGGRIGPRELFEMVTTNAARTAGVDDFLGRIAPGCAADLVLASKLDDDPFLSLLKTQPRNIELVFVGGQPIYGNVDRLRGLVPAEVMDVLSVDGETRGILTVGDLRTTPRAHERWDDIRRLLQTHLDTVAPLIEE